MTHLNIKTLRLYCGNKYKEGLFAPYTTDAVINELQDATEPLKSNMIKLIKDYDVKVFDTKPLALKLAKEYVDKGVIPQKFATDALHIANCSVEGLDVIVSLNFRHIVKMKTKIMCSAINALYGLKAPYIFAPQEVIDYERETHL